MNFQLPSSHSIAVEYFTEHSEKQENFYCSVIAVSTGDLRLWWFHVFCYRIRNDSLISYGSQYVLRSVFTIS